MEKLKSKNPVLPHGGIKPVVVTETTLNQNQFLVPGTLCGGENIAPGTLHGGEEIKPGTLHGGEEIRPGTLHGGEEIKPGTLHLTKYSPVTYRTKDGSGIYKFRFVDLGGKFEIDIESQPSYEGRDDSSVASHRLLSSRGGKKICISNGQEPKNLESAKRICMEWSELTQKYIKTGNSIDKQVMANSNPINKLRSHLMN